MSDDKIRKITEEALSGLVAQLEAGKSEALQNYLRTMSRFHRYSWGNVLLIAAQRPTATHVAGFHSWHQLDRVVKKGEKGIMILAPILVKNRAEELTAADEHAAKTSRLSGFRTAYVFDIEQTEGRPLPEFAQTTGNATSSLARLKEAVAARGIDLVYDQSIAPAQGASSGGRIRLMPGLSGAEEFSVLTHELAHEMLHHSIESVALPKAVRETQAEAIAFVVCRAVGLETNTAAADYIALYNGDKKLLTESLAVIQATSSKILDDLLPKQQREITTPDGVELGPPAARSRISWEINARDSLDPNPDNSLGRGSGIWNR